MRKFPSMKNTRQNGHDQHGSRPRIALRTRAQDCFLHGLGRESGNGHSRRDAPSRTAPTPPCQTTYHPSVIVVAQGRKQVNLGRTDFIYDASRFLLTAVDLPIVSWVVEATEEVPCLVLSLKLDMSMVREVLGREEIHVAEAASNSPAMSTGETTPEFFGACCRLVDLLDSPQDIPFLSGLIQREIIYRILRGPEGARLRAIATLGDQSHRTAKAIAWITANYAKHSARGRTRTACEHGRIHTAPSFPGADRDESASVSKTTPPAVRAEPDAEQWSRCRQCGF